MLFTKCAEELDPVHAKHIVIRDHAIGRPVTDPFQSFVGAGRRFDDKPTGLAFEKGCGQIHNRRVVIDMEDSNLVPSIDLHGTPMCGSIKKYSNRFRTRTRLVDTERLTQRNRQLSGAEYLLSMR